MFKIVDTAEEWNGILADFKHLDVFYCHEYTQLFAKVEQGAAKAAFYENNDTKILYPFILRDISIFGEQQKDIVTPYGYGGPYIEGSNEEIKKFYSEFSKYCKGNDIITETIRLHPLYKNKEYVKEVMDIRYIGKSIAVDLKQPYKDIWMDYSKNNQRNIKKAKESGMSAEIVPKTTENIAKFHHLYESTMNRKNAAEMYFFSEDFFCELLSDDTLYESFLLFVQYQNKVIAGLILLIGKEIAHYQFGGSNYDYLHLKPNNLLFDYMIRFCQEKGAKFLHLGGGHQFKNDGLYRFKSSFSNCPDYSYYLGTKIYNQEIFDQINEMASNHESFNQNFFPPYRSVLSK
ncbi:lipid II:glycine glycyltransferase FemX [Cytobacillus dafuensis]|nr:GNAT family N-acetyltransferase [Cytobacillus dafuensis]